jgi:hypothetical protein
MTHPCNVICLSFNILTDLRQTKPVVRTKLFESSQATR